MQRANDGACCGLKRLRARGCEGKWGKVAKKKKTILKNQFSTFSAISTLGRILVFVLREQARVKKGSGNSRNFRPTPAHAGVGRVSRRRPMRMKILVPSCVPDATRTHAFRVYLSKALVYI
jgi:hypothetical protein